MQRAIGEVEHGSGLVRSHAACPRTQCYQVDYDSPQDTGTHFVDELCAALTAAC